MAFSIPPNIVFDDLDGESVAINTVTGTYYSLTPRGSLVMKQIYAGREAPSDGPATGGLAKEGLILSSVELTGQSAEAADLFDKFTDIESLLMADPIHDVDEQGWPKIK